MTQDEAPVYVIGTPSVRWFDGNGNEIAPPPWPSKHEPAACPCCLLAGSLISALEERVRELESQRIEVWSTSGTDPEPEGGA